VWVNHVALCVEKGGARSDPTAPIANNSATINPYGFHAAFVSFVASQTHASNFLVRSRKLISVSPLLPTTLRSHPKKFCCCSSSISLTVPFLLPLRDNLQQYMAPASQIEPYGLPFFRSLRDVFLYSILRHFKSTNSSHYAYWVIMFEILKSLPKPTPSLPTFFAKLVRSPNTKRSSMQPAVEQFFVISRAQKEHRLC